MTDDTKPTERKPGPPVSGEVGWYRILIGHSNRVSAGWWTGEGWVVFEGEESPPEMPFGVVPLHDYPLVPGDALRKAEQTIRKLQAELDDLRKVHQDLVAAYERLVNDDTDERNAFEQGREYRFTGRGEEHGIEWEYETYDDWKAAEGGER